MEEWLQSYIKTNALNGRSIRIGNNLPIVSLPKIKDIDEIYTYLYLFTKYIELYNNKRKEMYFDIVVNEESLLDFCLFLRFFTDIESMLYDKSTFIYNDKEYINIENLEFFMQSIKILHHRDKKSDYEKIENEDSSPLAKYMRKLKEAKQRVEEKKRELKLDSNESGFAEILSTVSARHPSVNLINIQELNYYQILDQYKRLMKIDEYMPVFSGNVTEDYLKKLKHYSSKIINED